MNAGIGIERGVNNLDGLRDFAITAGKAGSGGKIRNHRSHPFHYLMPFIPSENGDFVSVAK